jgi:hypothetical protein
MHPGAFSFLGMGCILEAMESSSRQIVRIQPLSAHGVEDDLKGSTAGERFGMMWALAVDAWAFKGEPVGESRLPRHVVRVVRRGS